MLVLEKKKGLKSMIPALSLRNKKKNLTQSKQKEGNNKLKTRNQEIWKWKKGNRKINAVFARNVKEILKKII